MLRRDGAAGGLRTGLLLLVVLGVVGTALTLAYERHWGTTWQLAPWITLGIVSVALVALVVRQTTVTVRLARAVAILAVVSASLGVWQHIDANLDADAAADHRSDDSDDDETTDGDGLPTDGDGHDSDDDETTDGDGHDSDDGTSLADGDRLRRPGASARGAGDRAGRAGAWPGDDRPRPRAKAVAGIGDDVGVRAPALLGGPVSSNAATSSASAALLAESLPVGAAPLADGCTASTRS